MRKSLAVVAVAGSLLIGYAGLRVPVGAQPRDTEFLPFRDGQRVRLKVDLPDSSRVCIVTQVVNGFIGCAGDRTTPPGWINLRNVQEITPAPER
jgi:hypothetical protein